MPRKDKNWVNADILEFVRVNPAATVADLRAQFPFYADGTLSTQRIRALQELGLKKKPVHRNKKKKKAPKRSPQDDAQKYEDSLDAMANIPRAAFVPNDRAGTIANGAKRHVNLMTAEQEAHDKAVLLADAWVTWLKLVEDIPTSDAVDFALWVNASVKQSEYRRAKLLKRWEKLQIIMAVLSDAIAKIPDTTSEKIVEEFAEVAETIMSDNAQNTVECPHNTQ